MLRVGLTCTFNLSADILLPDSFGDEQAVARKGSMTRRAERLCAALLLPLGITACFGGADAPMPRRDVAGLAPPSADSASVPEAQDTSGSSQIGTGRIGTGKIKVALIVPLTGTGASIGTTLRNAAELAYEDFQRPDLTILIKDDRGTPEGAREAGQAALAEGAEAMLGPLFSQNVAAIGGPARQAGKPVIAFSTDANVAARGVYLISFLPQSETDRIVENTVAGGRRSFAALIPNTPYGNAVEAEFREAVARRGGRIVALERYAPGEPAPALKRIGGLIGGPSAQADALFLPGAPEQLSVVGQALSRSGFVPGRVKPIGTALWNDPRVLGLLAFQGGAFAAPDSTGFSSFSQRYQARYGARPPRVATLGYDAVSLAAALTRRYGSQAFSETTLTAPAGFAGIDGVFRFRPEGESERALAVYAIHDRTVTVASPAPRALGRPRI